MSTLASLMHSMRNVLLALVIGLVAASGAVAASAIYLQADPAFPARVHPPAAAPDHPSLVRPPGGAR